MVARSLWVLSPASSDLPNPDGRWISNSKLPHVQCSFNRLWIHCDSNQYKVVTEHE